MRILADENIGRGVIRALRAVGYDVLSVLESKPGLSDTEVLSMAQAQERVVITQDKDFGELAVRGGLPARSGIVLLRLRQGRPQDDAQRILAILTSRDDWSGHFSVVDDDKIRMRVLPPPSTR